MARTTSRLLALGLSAVFLGVTLSGCISTSAYEPQVREIRFWVEQIEWDVHPEVSTTVWAFCAEGDGVVYVHESPCSVPGPTIRVNAGDTVRITFDNTHHIAHTIHFHGRHPWNGDMNGAGAMALHQVAKAGQTQVIEWVADPAGSFIYHCHFQTPTHMEMGMYGAFIVDDPKDRTPVDHDFVAVLDEWSIHNESRFIGNMPAYNFFTINGKSYPATQPWIVDPGDKVRLHLVNAGFQFKAMHLHGYVPDAWEGVAGPDARVRTDVRTVAPGQTVVMEFDADEPGLWLFHDHVVPTVTAASQGDGFGAYPRGMLTVLVVGQEHADALQKLAPALLAEAARDAVDPEANHADHDHGADHGADPGADHGADPGGQPLADDDTDSTDATINMKDYAFADKAVTVPAGTTVTWTNSDPVVHQVSADDGSFDSGDIGAGGSFSHTFDTPGTYTYHCTPHAYQDDGAWNGMVGTVVVEA